MNEAETRAELLNPALRKRLERGGGQPGAARGNYAGPPAGRGKWAKLSRVMQKNLPDTSIGATEFQLR